MIDGPVFVGPHAVARFQQRIAPLPYEAARETILQGLRSGVVEVGAPKPMADGKASVRVMCHLARWRFRLAVVFGERKHGPLPVVVTVLPEMRGTSAGRGKPRREDRPGAVGAPASPSPTHRPRSVAGRFAGRPWTAEEDAVVGAELGERSLAQVAREIGRTPGAVRYRRWKLGRGPRGDVRRGRPWTREEEQFACDHLTTRTREWIAEQLGRTPRGVQQRLCRIHQHARNQDWLSSGAAAEASGYSQQHLSALARRGRLRARRVPGSRDWLFDPEGLPRRSDTPERATPEAPRRRALWTPEEDAAVLGPGASWGEIGARIGRSAFACRSRAWHLRRGSR